MGLLKKARSMATRLHAFQRYGDNLPYDYHLEEVDNVLSFFNLNSDNMRAAAWLHDSIEDTYLDYAKLTRMFNKEIAEIVYAVTDELGKNRHEKHTRTYSKIKGNVEATQLKLADRIANVKYSYFANSTGEKFDMYRLEHKEFEEGIRDKTNEPEITIKMWEYLEDIFKRGIH